MGLIIRCLVKAARGGMRVAAGLTVAALCWGAGNGAEPSFNGAFTQGGLVMGVTVAGSVVTLDGSPVPVTDAGVFLLGFSREAGPVSELHGRSPNGDAWRLELAIAPRDFKIQRINGLPSAQVTPPPEVLKRIRDESVRVARARATFREVADFLAGFQWPVQGPITGVYGSQRILNGEPRQPHFGVDIGVPTGTLVRAPAPGVVVLAEPDLYFSGGTLILDHGYGLSSSFLHLSALLVEPGTTVAAGDPIARVGATGRVTGPHLDWRMNLNKVRIDPTLVMEAIPASES